MKAKIKTVSMTLKVALLGVAVAFVGCDKISYDEIFEHTSITYENYCSDHKSGGSGDLTNDRYKDGKFTPPSGLNSQEKGLIGACDYKEMMSETEDIRLYLLCLEKYDSGECKKREKERKERFKKSCYVPKEPSKEDKTGFYKIDKDGSLLIDDKYRVLIIVKSAEYKEEGNKGYCNKREIYKLVKKE